jgi:hypothetical protein
MKRGYGELLKKAREEKGLKFTDVHKTIKIDELYVRAMEEENLAGFDKPIYMKLFLKTYSRFLKLDYKEILRMFDESPEVQEQLVKDKKREVTPIELRKEIVKEDPPADIKNRMPVELSLANSKNLLIYGGIGIAIILLLAILIAVISGKSKNDGTNVYPVKQVQEFKVTLKAREDCWMKVRVDEKEQEFMLTKGQYKEWKDAKKLVFHLGNAGGVEFTVNGEYVGAIGQANEVINGLVIENGKKWYIDAAQGFKSQPAPAATQAPAAAGEGQPEPGMTPQETVEPENE